MLSILTYVVRTLASLYSIILHARRLNDATHSVGAACSSWVTTPMIHPATEIAENYNPTIGHVIINCLFLLQTKITLSGHKNNVLT